MTDEVLFKNLSSGVIATDGSALQTLHKKGPNPPIMIIIFVCLFIGIIGNLFALVKLARRRTNLNRTYTMMLTFLTTNNLIGLLGVASVAIIKRFLLDHDTPWSCGSYVIFRFFGISSGCVALIMSIDRYILLTHPTFYQMNLTHKSNTIAILAMSFVAAIISVCPFFGFGVYFDKEKNQCLKYKEATTTLDRAYAFLFLIFGTLICTTIVTCNIFVIRAILQRRRRRLSNSSSSSSEPTFKEQSTLTELDIRFTKLMVLLSLIFVTCWMPQMIATMVALTSHPLAKTHWFNKLSELLISLLFTLDPYLYVFDGKNIVDCWGRCARSRRSLRIRSEARSDNDSTEITL